MLVMWLMVIDLSCFIHSKTIFRSFLALILGPPCSALCLLQMTLSALMPGDGSAMNCSHSLGARHLWQNSSMSATAAAERSSVGLRLMAVLCR